MLGILGGMGPAATVDLMRHLVMLTPAKNDDEHIPLIVSSDARLPSLARAIFEGGESPVPALATRIRYLEAAGAERIAIACHAAFHWYDEISRAARVPVIHMGDAVCDAVADRVARGTAIGLMAAASTLKSGYYLRKFAERGFPCTLLEVRENEDYVFKAIQLVKANQLVDAAILFRRAAQTLADRGAAVVVLACTEIPVALNAAPDAIDKICIDGTEALAKACIDWWSRRIEVTRNIRTTKA